MLGGTSTRMLRTVVAVVAFSRDSSARFLGAHQISAEQVPAPPQPRRAPFAVVKSEKELAAKKAAPARPAKRDCVRKPTISVCDCKEMIAACDVERDFCLTAVARLRGGDDVEAETPQQALFRAKFDHPLLNTFAQLPVPVNGFGTRVSEEDVDFTRVKSRGKCSAEEMGGIHGPDDGKESMSTLQCVYATSYASASTTCSSNKCCNDSLVSRKI
ncbi:unnamed protein product [Amoebophrya sp. A25]|nr:unnamed protein product [Amoebophrya sp. A25]|eukprot:GSA25T00002101001.1